MVIIQEHEKHLSCSDIWKQINSPYQYSLLNFICYCFPTKKKSLHSPDINIYYFK